MPNVRDRHVVGVLEKFIPIEVAIEHSRAVSGSLEFSAVIINARNTSEEFFTIVEEVAIVVKVVDIDFEAPLAYLAQELVRHFVANLGNHLERRLDAKGIIQVH